MPEAVGAKIPFGMADITIGEGAGAIVFDGKTNLQAEGGEVNLEPAFEDVVVADFGTSVYDKRFVGLEGTVTIVAAEDTIKMLELAMSYADAITETADPATTVGLMDGKIGASMRARAKKVTIHPRQLPASDKSMDITLYKMASVGGFTKSYANSQGNRTIELSLFPRDGFDANKPGNFYYVGGKDPNATT